MKNNLLVIAALVLCTASMAAPLQASTWVEVLKQDDITLSQRLLPGKTYKQVAGSTVIPGTIGSLVAIMDNTAFCPRWLTNCRSSRTVKKISAAERIDYMVMDAPFLLSDRDMYVSSTTSYDSKSHTVTIQMNGQEKHAPPQEGRVRVLDLQGQWRFQQLNEQQVKIEYLMYSDPQITPASAVDASSYKGVFKTLSNLRKLANSPKLRNSKLDPARLKAITVR